jgi:hypothetical protein
MSCRDIKAKCLLSTPSSGPQDPCARCVRLGLGCVYTPKRRPTRYARFGGITYARAGDGQSESKSPAAVTSSSVVNPNNAANNIPGNVNDPYSSFSAVLDPSLAPKYGQNAQVNPRSASSAMWNAYGNLSTGLGVAGEYDMSATRTSIQDSGAEIGDELMGKQDEDQSLAMHYSRRTMDYGMSGAGTESSPVITLNTLSESHSHSSTSNNGQHRTPVDHRFDNNSSTPARAATGMDLVSDLSNMRSSASGNPLSMGGNDAYRLPTSTFRYNSATLRDVGSRGEAGGLAYERSYAAAPGEFSEASLSRSLYRNGQLVNNSTSANLANHHPPPSLSMIVHGPTDESGLQQANISDSLTLSSRPPKRRRISSPSRNTLSEKTHMVSTGFAPDDSNGEVVAAGRYDAVRCDREEAEENKEGMDWTSEMLKRGGFQGTECPIALGLVTEDEVRFLFDQ